MHKEESVNVQSISTKNDYQKHVNLSIQLNRWLLEPFGIWSSEKYESGTKKYLSWLIRFTFYSLIIFVTVPCCTYVILDVEDVYTQIKFLGPLSFYMTTFVNYSLLIHHQDDIRKCIEFIKGNWKDINCPEDKKIMIIYANYGRRMIVICTLFVCTSSLLYYFILPISVGKITADDANVTFIPLPIPVSKFIVDARYSPTNEICFSIQAATGILMHVMDSAACSLAAMFSVHACGQLQVLINWLEHWIDGRTDMNKTVNGRTAFIVSQHVEILKFLAVIEKTLQKISLFEFLNGTINMCLLGYYIIKEWNPKDVSVSFTYLILLSSFTFNIFIFCYIGEIISEQCRKVGEMSYMIEWYRLTGHQRLYCILIMAMSNSSIKLTAGNIIILSIDTFSSVLKTAMAFFNMLRAVT